MRKPSFGDYKDSLSIVEPVEPVLAVHEPACASPRAESIDLRMARPPLNNVSARSLTRPLSAGVSASSVCTGRNQQGSRDCGLRCHVRCPEETLSDTYGAQEVKRAFDMVLAVRMRYCIEIGFSDTFRTPASHHCALRYAAPRSLAL